MNRVVDRLNGHVNRVQYSAETKWGTPPYAYGLSKQAVQYAKENFPWTDPKEFSSEHSPHTLEHEIKRARTHAKVVELCQKNGWELSWKKTDLKHVVDPDDAFEIVNPQLPEGKNVAHFFYEEENKKKDFEDLYEKFARYEKLYGTPDCKKHWDFTKFWVIVQMPNEERRKNILHYLATTNLKTRTFLFTTDELITTNPGGKIFLTPKDYENKAYGFLDFFPKSPII